MHNPEPIIYKLHEIDKPIKVILELFQNCSVFTFTGVLGAGKTTFIKELLKQKGVTETVVSPTFMYMIEYSNQQYEQFYHFDLYRVKTIQDFVHAGFMDYIYQPHSWSFIEWPDVIMPLLDKKACYIHIDYYSEDERILRYELSPDIAKTCCE